jgi:D-lactate dehydrogenase (cytochrome)
VQGGVCIDLSQMNQVLAVHERTSTPWCRRASRASSSTNNQAHGPASSRSIRRDATLGGMTATRASGTNAVRYGTMREKRDVAEGGAGRRPHHPDLAPRKKSAAGYD